MNRFRNIFHSEMPWRDWPDLTARYFWKCAFFGFPARGRDSEARRKKKQEYYLQNKEKIDARNRVWKIKNSESYSATQRAYNSRNRAKNREYHRNYRVKEYQTNPQVRLATCLRTRLYQSLRGRNKSARTLELLGCSVLELRLHLERQFRPGMSWENHGSVWQIDHILPIKGFDLNDPGQQRACFHWSNLQPLFS